MLKLKVRNVLGYWPAWVGAACLLVMLIGGAIYTSVASAASTDKASGKHMVTIHDDGHDRGILTSATTLRQVLHDAKISLDPHDTVEPGLDEPLTARNYDVNIYRARPVTVVDGPVRTKIMTAHRTPRQVMADAHLTLHDEDIATYSRTTGMVSEGAGVVLTIDRATPFTLVLYGKVTEAYTQSKTVGDMLTNKGITLAPDDTVSAPLTAPMKAGMRVELWRNGTQTVNAEETIPFETKKVEDPNRPVGYREVTTPGVNGTKNVTYEVVMKNGQEVSRQEIQSVVTKQPQEQVEIVGTKNNYSGSLNEWLAALRACEAGGSYSRNSGNGYYGAYQFSQTTWNSTARAIGRPDLVGVVPSNATAADQDAMIIANTNRTAGLRTQNPGCYAKMGLSNYPPDS